MRIRKHGAVTSLLAGVLLLFGTGDLHAQKEGPTVGEPQQQSEADSTQPASSADLVSVETRLAATPVPAGESVRAALVLDIRDGWHVNAHRPTFDYLIGTTLDWDASSDVAVGNVQYPEPKRFEFDFAGDAIDVYEERAPIFFDVRPAPGTAPDERRLTGQLRLQACNDRTCLQPSTVTTSLSVPVEKAGAASTPTDDPIFKAHSSTLPWDTVMTIFWRYGALIAGTIMAVGTIGGLVVYSWITSDSEEK